MESSDESGILVFFFLYRTQSGTFKDGDLLVNRDGVRIVSKSEVEAVRNLSFAAQCIFRG